MMRYNTKGCHKVKVNQVECGEMQWDTIWCNKKAYHAISLDWMLYDVKGCVGVHCNAMGQNEMRWNRVGWDRRRS